jgi:saccharopine dehydrogenase (NADP+, L-glutamate forming)
MKTILVLGAGRSSPSLINYLLTNASRQDWRIVIGDVSIDAAQARIGRSENGVATKFDIHDDVQSKAAIEKADVVISLLPAALHVLVAKYCIRYNKHFFNASYVSEELKALHPIALKNDLLFLNECGLDPGIDHMSAMQVIDKIKSSGGVLTSFESFTGGLIAPETDPENPWRYKFTWNPRNVVLAGQGTAKFLVGDQYKYVPYQRLFSQPVPVEVSGMLYEGYPNRDSLKYLTTYGIDKIQTMIRGTLRNIGYCSAWNVFVQLGCCDDSYSMEGVSAMTHRDYINSFLTLEETLSLEERICRAIGIALDGEELQRLRWSGLLSTEKIGLSQGTPAQILEHILDKKWKLNPGDKDLIVMWHRFGYTLQGIQRTIISNLSVTGENETETAMAKTVGLPLGIAAKLFLEGKIEERGVVIPIRKEFYDPILSELSTLGIRLTEREII